MAKARTLTIQQLHKQLGQLVEAGHGRQPICVDKASFYHPCEEDGVTILHAHSIELEPVLLWQDAGTTDPNGREHYRQALVLRGDCRQFRSVLAPGALLDYIRDCVPVTDDRTGLVSYHLRKYAQHLRKLVGTGG